MTQRNAQWETISPISTTPIFIRILILLREEKAAFEQNIKLSYQTNLILNTYALVTSKAPFTGKQRTAYERRTE